MSKLRLNETASAPTVTQANKVDITVGPNKALRLTDINGTAVYQPSVYGNSTSFGSKSTTESNNTTAYKNYITVPYEIESIDPLAIYEISVSFVWRHSSASTDYMGRLLVNGAVFGQPFKEEPKDAGTDQRLWRKLDQPITGDVLATLTGDLAWEFAASSAGTTATTHFVYIKMKRIA